jgi:hypothetical protein
MADTKRADRIGGGDRMTKKKASEEVVRIIEVELDTEGPTNDECPFNWDGCMCNHPNAKWLAWCCEDGPESCPLHVCAVLVRMKP